MNKPISHIALAAILALTLVGTAFAGWEEGVAAFKSGNLDAAATEFAAVAEKQPEWPGGHFMLGWTYLKQKNNKAAVASLRKAYDLNPSDVNYQLRLGEAYVADKQYGNAIAFLSKINEAAVPENLRGRLHQLLGLAYSKQNDTGRALGQFEKAAQLAPNDAQAQYQYGTMAYNQGDTRGAVTALAKAASLDAGDTAKQSAYAKALNRQGRESRGDAKISAYTKAAAAAQRVVAAKPTYDNTMLLGEAQLGAKRYDEAITSFEAASSKNSGDWLPHFYIGQAHTAKQQHRSAEAALKKALDKASSSADKTKIWKQLGFVYEKQKNYNEAILAYNQAGDSAGARRATENRDINQYNQDVDATNTELERMQKEAEEIKKQLKDMPGGPPPGV
jgi:tetratricopeptide (TPR) repeat protein